MANAIIYSSDPDFARGIALALKEAGARQSTLAAAWPQLENAIKMAKKNELLFVLLSAKELTTAGFEGLMLAQNCIAMLESNAIPALLLEPEHAGEEAELTGLLGIDRVVRVPEDPDGLDTALRKAFPSELGPPKDGASTRPKNEIRPLRAKPDKPPIRPARPQPHHGTEPAPQAPTGEAPPSPRTRKVRGANRPLRPSRKGPTTRQAAAAPEAAKSKEPLPTAAPQFTPEVFFEKGLASMERGMYPHAYQAFAAAAAGDPKNLEYLAHKAWAMVLTDEKRADEARQVLKDLDTLGGEASLWANTIRGRLAAAAGDVPAALKAYGAVVAIEPLNREADDFVKAHAGNNAGDKKGLFGKLFKKE